ncbi:MAG: right-handed parallel beta-helix repeat-containing protein [Sedimentisphaerales bacterium]|nr:right-handed parallel beta-helix repeat-containing protein [Sedimentisphaerales bacterium]
MRIRVPLSLSLLSCLLLTCSMGFAADIIYVSAAAAGLNNGTTWADAYTSLQPALADADPCDQIWIAQATYYPDPCGLTDAREACFQMKNNVTIYGGFPDSGNPTLENRNPQDYHTILNGDLQQNDVQNLDPCQLLNHPSRQDNCYHVFHHPIGTNLDNTAVIDGVTISGGNAAGQQPAGGGMYNEQSSPRLVNCTFINNAAELGGGAIHNSETNSLMEQCRFVKNASGNWGGAISNFDGSPKAEHCVFTSNVSGSWSGAIDNLYGDVVITNCTFVGNSADFAGAVGNVLNNATITDCIFNGNYAFANGGAIANENTVSTALTNCVFSANQADAGGAVENNASSPKMVNCTLSGNTAQFGGAVYNYNSNPTLTNCILWGNTTMSGAQIYDQDSVPIITYCCVQGGYPGLGNIGDDPLFADPAGLDNTLGTKDDNLRLPARSPAVDAGDNTIVTAPTDFDQGPRIIDGHADGTLIVDIGAYETRVIFVDASVTAGGDDGTTWTNAFDDLQKALNIAAPGDQIWVAKGTYYPSVQVSTCGTTTERSRAFQLLNGVTIYGGFFADEDPAVFDLAQRDLQTNQTILSGDIGIPTDPTDNCYHVFLHTEEINLDHTAVLDGVTITGGNADGEFSCNDDCGGGIYTVNGSPTINNCTFLANNAYRHGGGLYTMHSPTLNQCAFINNSADSGAGLYNFGGQPTLTDCDFIANDAYEGAGFFGSAGSQASISDCDFSDNSASRGAAYCGYGDNSILTNCLFTENVAYDGGAAYLNMSTPTIQACTFTANIAGMGGALCNAYGSLPAITNCTFSGNSAYYGGAICEQGGAYSTNCVFVGNTAYNGAGIYNMSSATPNIVNCTITSNVAQWAGGGIYNTFDGMSSPMVSLWGCIVWGNAAPYWPQIYEGNTSTMPTVSYSCIQGGGYIYPGLENIKDDPLFIRSPYDGGDGWGDDPSTTAIDESSNDDFGNLRLQPGSPCVDTGGDLVINPADRDGHNRLIDGNCDTIAKVDMGAYEHDWLYYGDFLSDCNVNLNDFAILAANWLTDNPAIDIFPFIQADNIIDQGELATLAAHWLDTIEP